MTPMTAFELNMADAHMLVQSAVAFDNQRAARRMRAELRRRVGEALKVPQRRRDELNCLQSDDLFVVFLPGASVTPGHFGTVMGFKGLERPVVVLAVDGFHDGVAREVMYTGLSRARDQLVVCGDVELIGQVAGREVARRLTRA
jgi:ribosomal protein L18E